MIYWLPADYTLLNTPHALCSASSRRFVRFHLYKCGCKIKNKKNNSFFFTSAALKCFNIESVLHFFNFRFEDGGFVFLSTSCRSFPFPVRGKVDFAAASMVYKRNGLSEHLKKLFENVRKIFPAKINLICVISSMQ